MSSAGTARCAILRPAIVAMVMMVVPMSVIVRVLMPMVMPMLVVVVGSMIFSLVQMFMGIMEMNVSLSHNLTEQIIEAEQ